MASSNVEWGVGSSNDTNTTFLQILDANLKPALLLAIMPPKLTDQNIQLLSPSQA